LKVFVTGIEGFVGRHLADHLLSAGYEVSGTVWEESQVGPLQERFDLLRLFQADIRNRDVMSKVLKETGPDAIIHLAAQSSGFFSYQNPRLTFEVNVLGTVNILETVNKLTPDARVILVCSSDVYGKVDKEMLPLKESTPFCPINPYSASKAAQDLLGVQYYYSHGLNIVRTRSFPHTGPGQSAVFALSNFARQIAAIESQDDPKPMGVGNLDVVRDYLDVQDVVRAYEILINKGYAGDVYNIASGTGYRLGDLLDTMLTLSIKNIEVDRDPDLFRPSDIPILIGDSTKFRELTGWEPTVPIKDTLRRLLDYWRAKQKQGAV
jgi:GDP-4-dehydro-6-deoxy-D-mannose reductase